MNDPMTRAEANVCHAKIALILGDMAGCQNQPAAFQELLRSFEEEVLGYVSRQDRSWYEALRLRYQGDSAIVRLLDFFELDLVDLRVSLIEFLHHAFPQVQGVHYKVFFDRFRALSRVVQKRLEIESERLLPLL